MSASQRFFVITGGPGAGKTTLIKALGGLGYASSQEAGRAIIQDQVAIGGSALPWANRELYSQLQLSWEMGSYHHAEATSGPVFFDRGVPDVIGYLRLCELEIPAHLYRAAARFTYARQVFIVPPWPEIFSQDAERKQDFKEAAKTCDMMAAVYEELGYTLVEVPRLTVADRVHFVLDAIA